MQGCQQEAGNVDVVAPDTPTPAERHEARHLALLPRSMKLLGINNNHSPQSVNNSFFFIPRYLGKYILVLIALDCTETTCLLRARRISGLCARKHAR